MLLLRTYLFTSSAFTSFSVLLRTSTSPSLLPVSRFQVVLKRSGARLLSSPMLNLRKPELNSFGSGVAETLRTGRRTTGTTVSGIFLTRNLAGFFASQRFQIGRHTVFYSDF